MRLFIAVEFPANILVALTELQREIRANVERGRFKRSENFHLTLKFLGETPRETLDKLVDRLGEAAEGQQEFSLRLGQVGVFGDSPPIRVIWQGLAGDTDRLYSLQQAVERECVAIGLASEKRPYSPHITLAQDVTPLPGKSYLPRMLPDLPFAVKDFALVLSEEKNRKRLYTILHSFALGKN